MHLLEPTRYADQPDTHVMWFARLLSPPVITIGTPEAVQHLDWPECVVLPITVTNGGEDTGLIGDWKLTIIPRDKHRPTFTLENRPFDKADFGKEMEKGFVGTARICFAFTNEAEKNLVLQHDRLRLTVSDASRRTLSAWCPNA